MKINDVKYICRDLLKIDWIPELGPDALEVLSRCDSKLEMMYLLGACDFIRRQSEFQPTFTTSVVNLYGKSYEGIWFFEPWFGWYLDDISDDRQGGPSALLFVPQFKSPEKEITHDLALFYGDDNGSPTWSLKHLIEIDGYGVHSSRRDKDSMRDNGLSYTVHRFYEETDDPLDWFRKIVHTDAGLLPR
ncbi:hypothetical protein [Microbulbifer celer]|uniref:Uncharacterized protein n=1 Tax=Microbulbifer celer TaxID=435905 RepID=A0ABW3U2M5_9GAMM|nr:hypothetical protein [Microbulbifer celer]UFN58225.1 hypothetical protein LPW13_04045 [Microbulbifer celer]